MRLAAIALAPALVAALALGRGGRRGAEGLAALVGLTLGGVLPAVPLFVESGVFAPRVVLPSPVWTAAPLWVWPVAGMVAVAAMAAALAGTLARLRRR